MPPSLQTCWSENNQPVSPVGLAYSNVCSEYSPPGLSINITNSSSWGAVIVTQLEIDINNTVKEPSQDRNNQTRVCFLDTLVKSYVVDKVTNLGMMDNNGNLLCLAYSTDEYQVDALDYLAKQPGTACDFSNYGYQISIKDVCFLFNYSEFYCNVRDLPAPFVNLPEAIKDAEVHAKHSTIFIEDTKKRITEDYRREMNITVHFPYLLTVHSENSPFLLVVEKQSNV
eukprot:TRINITY_DN18811_c0_g1_i1.p1 TRINITY_DN18811_c0_g1~~TRINITY_DN18811_c0_g1_i1.p1  ORF type:complete len:227 (-),score=40.73 TRINITY_DN18811_c0_g1_i1:95-775(-)